MELNAQATYARLLAWGTWLGLALLVASFVAYLSGVAPHVPIEQLPELWKLPAGEFLRRTQGAAGWGWARALPASDMLVLAAIAVLSTCSIPSLLAAARTYFAAHERLLAAICVLEVAVLLLAASSVLGGGH